MTRHPRFHQMRWEPVFSRSHRTPRDFNVRPLKEE